ncbi:MAG TPA: hypothetical protein VK967_05690 [Methylotenera sp.]|nr:hypothetical protein [Methylotenera sp.]
MKLPLLVSFTLISSYAFAQEQDTCRNGLFPSYSDVQYAEISSDHGRRVHFREDTKNCPESDTCQKKAYLVDGDKILIAQTTEQWACAWYFGKQQEFVGWLPRNAIKKLQLKSPTIQDWIGTWRPITGNNEIKIFRSKTGKLSASGIAYWYGGKNSYNTDIVHTGELGGEAAPNGNKLTFGNKQEEYECAADMQLVYGNLIVSDNGNCGGMNVRFDDVYRRRF